MELNELTKDERSLLLYVETCAVDNGGLIHSLRVNDADREILKRWDKDGFVSYSRVTFKSLQLLNDKNHSNIVRLSDSAWKLAHEERRARSIRVSGKSPYCDLITVKTGLSDWVESEKTA